uniref:Uncharacterized protein n=1 Tax=Setaria viridis TaxID=4556 RepID=A0A4U6TKL9_SETVI|nr:hypothetical protein SEVIR_8G199533v2 [Setaria viridis]
MWHNRSSNLVVGYVMCDQIVVIHLIIISH